MTQTPRLGGGRLWAGTVVLLAAVLVGLRTLATVIQAAGWLTTASVAVAILAAVVGVLRQVLRSRLAPTAWGLLGIAIGVAGQYGGLTTRFSLPRPTAETAERVRLLVEQGQQTIVEGRIPVQPTRGLEMLVVVGVLLTYLAAELVGIGLGRGGLAGLPLLALWSPAVSYETDIGLPLLAAGGATYVLLLAITRRRPRRHDLGWRRETSTALTAAVVVTVGALVVGTAAGALPFAGIVRLPSSWGAQDIDSPLRLSTDLDMRADLDGRSDRPLLEYTGSSRVVGALRLYTLSTFDGQEWHRGRGQTQGWTDAEGLLWPEAAEEAEEPELVSVRVLGLEGDRLPIPGEPREIAADGFWSYDATRDEVIGSDTSTRGLAYELSISPRDLSADGLREDTAGRPAGAVSTYLDVPPTQHANDTRALVDEIIADEETVYDQAVAIQSYLRSAQNFEYDTELAPPRTDDAVWDFLTSRRGYCVQFATAMTLMARMAGIPARMAVGFLPGSPDDERRETYVVTARHAHTWPELYFADAGWVRFEPTPAGQTGAPPAYADPFALDPLAPTAAPTGPAMPSSLPSVQPSVPGAQRPGFVNIGEAELPVAAVASVVGLLALVALLVAAVLWRRHRRRERVPVGAEEWWARLRADLAEHGVSWSDATTPRQAAGLVRGRLEGLPDAETNPGTTTGPGDAAEAGGVATLTEAAGALDALVAAVEADRYSPRPASATADELAAWVATIEQPLAPAGTTVTEDRPERT